jgi:hypothetical protein
VTVRALLNGHEFNLRTLVDMYPAGAPCVVRDDGGRYHLEASELDPHMADAGRLVEIAERVLGDLVGTARLTHSDFQPVNVAGSFESFDGPNKSIHATDSAVGRERAVVARPEPAMIRAGARVTAAATHPEGEVPAP